MTEGDGDDDRRSRSGLPGFRLPGNGDCWADLAACLLRRGAGQDHADDVQEAMTRLWSLAGPQPDPAAAVPFCLFIIRCLQVDRFRRHKPCLLGNGDADVQDRSAAPDRLDLRREPELAADLGSAAIELIERLSSGSRKTKELAMQLATSPAAIRKRRRRIVAKLGEFLQLLQVQGFCGEGSPQNG